MSSESISPPGQSSTTLQVTPVADFIARGNRSISMAVAADFALVSDAAQPAVVTLQDKPFDAWRFANFTDPEPSNPSKTPAGHFGGARGNSYAEDTATNRPYFYKEIA